MFNRGFFNIGIIDVWEAGGCLVRIRNYVEQQQHLLQAIKLKPSPDIAKGPLRNSNFSR